MLRHANFGTDCKAGAQGNLLGITTFMIKDAQNLNFAIAADEYAK
jgi:hypothetical protein